MRMKIIKGLHAAARCIWRIVEVRIPMDKVYGLRTAEGN